MSTPELTHARHAVWAAVNAADDLRAAGQSVFRRQLRFDDEPSFLPGGVESIEETIGPGDLPCLAILWGRIAAEWNRNTDMEWTFPLNVFAWTPNHSLLLPEKYAERLIVAIHEQQPTGQTISFVQQATGHHPKNGHSLQFVFSHLGEEPESPVVRTELTVQLRIWKSIT